MPAIRPVEHSLRAFVVSSPEPRRSRHAASPAAHAAENDVAEEALRPPVESDDSTDMLRQLRPTEAADELGSAAQRRLFGGRTGQRPTDASAARTWFTEPMSRRPPPKQRHRERPRRPSPRHEQSPDQRDDSNGYSAPGHLAGQFDQHDYGHGHGAFGFTQHLLP